MGVDEVQAGRGAKVSQQSRLDVLDLQRLAEKRIGIEINLADGKVVGGAPVGVDLAQLFGSKWLSRNAMRRRVYRGWGVIESCLSPAVCYLKFPGMTCASAREGNLFRGFDFAGDFLNVRSSR